MMPSVNVHAQGKAAGALVEIATGRVVFLANAESEETGLCRSYYTREKRDQMDAKMRDVLLKKLADAVLEKLRQQQTALKTI